MPNLAAILTRRHLSGRRQRFSGHRNALDGTVWASPVFKASHERFRTLTSNDLALGRTPSMNLDIAARGAAYTPTSQLPIQPPHRLAAPAPEDDVELGLARRPAAEPPLPVLQRVRTAVQVHPPVVVGTVPLRDVYPLMLRTLPRVIYASTASVLTVLGATRPDGDDDPGVGKLVAGGLMVGLAGVFACAEIVTRAADRARAWTERREIERWRHSGVFGVIQLGKITEHAVRNGPLDEVGLRRAVDRLLLVQERNPESVSGDHVAQSIAGLASAAAEPGRWHPARLDVLASAITQLYRSGQIQPENMARAMAALSWYHRHLPARQLTQVERYVVSAVADAPRDASERRLALVYLDWNAVLSDEARMMIVERLCESLGLPVPESGTSRHRLAAVILQCDGVPQSITAQAASRLSVASPAQQHGASGPAVARADDDEAFDEAVSIHLADRKHAAGTRMNRSESAAPRTGVRPLSDERHAPAADLQAWVAQSPATRAGSTPE